MRYPTPAPACLRAVLRAAADAALWLAGVTASPTDYRPAVGRPALRLRAATLRADAAHEAREAVVWRGLAREVGDTNWLHQPARKRARAHLANARRLRQWARATLPAPYRPTVG